MAFVPGLCQELLSQELVRSKARTSAGPNIWLPCNLKENKTQCLTSFPEVQSMYTSQWSLEEFHYCLNGSKIRP